MKVIGVSGSPIPDSNTDRAVKAVLEATGIENEFIKLKDYSISPCNACLGCVKTNQCVIKEDDGRMLTNKAREADALVVGAYAPYSGIDARTKAFLERLYPLRHGSGLMKGKVGAAVVTHAIPLEAPNLPPAAENAVEGIHSYMLEEGLNFIGAVTLQGNVPCIRCGMESECENSGLKMIFGHRATVDSVGIHAFENHADSLRSARELGQKIGIALMRK